MTADNLIPQGVYTPIVTFFKSDKSYSLDLSTQVEHAKFLYKNGITGVVAAGSMGEAGHMTRSERNSLVKAIREAIPDPEFKIIAGAPPLSVKEAEEEAVSAQRAGADFIILLVPGYFGPHLTSQEGLVEYFETIASSSPIPVMIYNYPGVANNVTLLIDSYKRLSQHSNISGVKLTHFNLDLYALLGKDDHFTTNGFRTFTGLGQVLVPAMSVGIQGTIDGLSGIFPKTMVKLYSLVKEGNFAEAAELQYLVTRADQMIMDLNLVGTKHAIAKYHGWGECLTGRPPLSKKVDNESYGKYSPYLDAVMAIEKNL